MKFLQLLMLQRSNIFARHNHPHHRPTHKQQKRKKTMDSKNSVWFLFLSATNNSCGFWPALSWPDFLLNAYRERTKFPLFGSKSPFRHFIKHYMGVKDFCNSLLKWCNLAPKIIRNQWTSVQLTQKNMYNPKPWATNKKIATNKNSADMLWKLGEELKFKGKGSTYSALAWAAAICWWRWRIPTRW